MRTIENRRYQAGPANENRLYRTPSREREDAYYDSIAAIEREERREAEIAWLIEHGPLPPEPTVTYDGNVATITLKEAGRRLGRSEVTLRSAIRRGRMVGHKLGRDWLVEEAEVRYYEMTVLGRVGWPKGRPRKMSA